MEHSLNKIEALKESAGRLLFDSAAEGLLIVDHQGDILVANPQLEEMFGYGAGELMGTKLEILIPMSKRAEHVQYRDSYNESPKKRSMGQGMDLLAVRKNGQEFPVEVSLNYLQGEAGLQVVALVTDISERKLAEQKVHDLNHSLEQKVQERTRALRESQHLYRTIARNFPNGTITVFDRNLRYVFAEGQELFRYKLTSENLMGTSYLDRLSEEVREEIEPKLRGVLEGKDVSFELESRGESYLLNAVGLPDVTGEIQQVLVVEQNITQQKKVQEKVELALIKERELNELKSRFVSMASHEFRTPLSTILTSTTLLQRYNETREVQKREKHHQRIRQSVQNLTNILNDFLSLDKLEEGRIEANGKDVNVHELLSDVVEEMETHCKAGQSIKYIHNDQCSTITDDQILRNVIINLLSNAIKYSPEQSEIELHCTGSEKEIIIQVTDKGIGIPEEEQEHLFTRFFRASNAINIQGTGLGLHIVKRYVELLNGKLEFTSASERGTTFNVTLPRN